MDTAVRNTTADTAVRTLLESWQKAAKAGNLDAIMSHYAADVVAFDVFAALQFKGIDAYRKHWQACLGMCSGPTTFNIQELNISAAEDIAFSHCLNQCGGVDNDGNEHLSWMRVTTGYRKTNGQWRIVHEHFFGTV